jgi:hypothetical protein
MDRRTYGDEVLIAIRLPPRLDTVSIRNEFSPTACFVVKGQPAAQLR